MKRIFLATVLAVTSLFSLPSQAAQPPQGLTIGDTVARMQIADDVSIDDAIDSMKLRANTLNFKMVAHMPLWKEAQSMGTDSKRIEIFQFCDASIAAKMVAYDMNFAAYMPCRIAVVEGDDGKNWLVMVDLQFFMGTADLPKELMEYAIKVRDTLTSIMEAGATGDL